MSFNFDPLLLVFKFRLRSQFYISYFQVLVLVGIRRREGSSSLEPPSTNKKSDGGR